MIPTLNINSVYDEPAVYDAICGRSKSEKYGEISFVMDVLDSVSFYTENMIEVQAGDCFQRSLLPLDMEYCCLDVKPYSKEVLVPKKLYIQSDMFKYSYNKHDCIIGLNNTFGVLGGSSKGLDPIIQWLSLLKNWFSSSKDFKMAVFTLPTYTHHNVYKEEFNDYLEATIPMFSTLHKRLKITPTENLRLCCKVHSVYDPVRSLYYDSYKDVRVVDPSAKTICKVKIRDSFQLAVISDPQISIAARALGFNYDQLSLFSGNYNDPYYVRPFMQTEIIGVSGYSCEVNAPRAIALTSGGW